MTFVKYVGGKDMEDRDAVDTVKMLREASVNAVQVPNSETSELSKIGCTTRYGMEITVMKEMEKMCEKYGADMEYVWGWHNFYNEGYKRLGMAHFSRSLLKPMPGEIGGHCVINNAKLMPDEPMMKYLLERNDEYAKAL